MAKPNWFRSLRSRLIIISLLPLAGLSISIFLLIGSLNILSSARAYVGGESLWAKAQKEATYHLLKYSTTHSEDDYQSAIRSLQIPLGDRQAREGLDKTNPDLAHIRQGFLIGGINKDDVSGMIWLYRNFHSVGYFARPISVWQHGDELITQLQTEADGLHKDIQSSAGNVTIAARLSRIDDLDNQLTVAENQFSSLMGEASRWIMSTLLVLNAVALLLVMLLTFRTMKIINQRTVSEIDEIYALALRAAAGDYSGRIDALKTDELSRLGETLNSLISAVSKAKVRLQSELYKSENSRREKDAILSSIIDGLLVINKDREIVLFNEAAARISGTKIDKAIGKRYDEILQFSLPQTKATETHFVDIALRGHIATTETEVLLAQSEGRHLAVAASAAPLRDSSKGRISGAIIIFRDVTKERELDRAKTEFVSLASHQLRTPLTAIGWYTEMLLAGEGGKMSAEQISYLNEIESGNVRMVELVNSLLDVSRIETGTFRVDPEPTDLIAMAKDVVKETEPDIFKRKQELIEDYDPNTPKLPLDPKLSRMIIQNLLSNASKYTKDKGKIILKIYTSKTKLHIDVTDNGYGIPKKQQSLIFKKLFRADNVFTLDTGGTGLGLYIIKSIVEQTGGKIWFKSVENKGTTFFVELPIAGMKPKRGDKELGE